MALRVLLVVLGVQKAVDALSLFPPIADYVLRLVAGVESVLLHDPFHALLAKLWGCASLLWAYVLLRASVDPKRHAVIVEGSIIGFLAAGIVGVALPYPGVRLCGILFLAEAVLLLIGRIGMGKHPQASMAGHPCSVAVARSS